MKQIPPLIISASAGTGKTFRLAIEYVRLLLRYYGKDGFRPDNILVLTFTRKATAEIRERIQDHLIMLCRKEQADQDKRTALLECLRDDGSSQELDIKEQNLLESALRDISNDRKMLQVMTLDSYINSIFRNIVRPLRSLDEFEIDVLAIEKRMPFLLGHLMSPDLKKRVDALLKRRVSSSLDRYRTFFASLIQHRWLHHLISDRLANPSPDTLQYHFRNREDHVAEESLSQFMLALEILLDEISSAQLESGKELEKYFNSAFKDLFRPFPDNEAAILQQIRTRCKDPREALRVLSTFSKGNLYNGSYLRKPRTDIVSLQDRVRRHLANYLVHTIFLDEQEEILAVWDAILKEYDQLIYRYRNMTYDDLAWFSLEAISSTDVTHMDGSIGDDSTDIQFSLSHRSRFILIDEFQDTSLLQFAILRPIILEVSAGEGSKNYGGLVVVGDDKQSIFGWRGGERDLILNLQNIFPTLGEVQTEVLDRSWRSTPTLVNYVNAVFTDQGLHEYLQGNGITWPYPQISSTRKDEDHLSRISFSCLPHQKAGGDYTLDQLMRDWVRREIDPLVSRSQEETMAVLCRDNKQLEQLQLILDEFGIPSIYQPNSVLTQHPKVKPLIAWMRWLAYREWTDWLEFLRSDYVMLRTEPLKKVLHSIKAYDSTPGSIYPDFSEVPVAQELYELSADIPDSLVAICNGVLDRFLPGIQASERDFQNLMAFLNVLSGFEASDSELQKDIPSFLQFLEDNRKQDELKQVAVEGADSLQLLTIHKSKGLQFERVFVLYNLSSGHAGDRDVLNWFIRFADSSYSSLGDFALTYHYPDILKHSDFGDLHTISQNRAMLEELNNLYVAFTRAKTKLHILFTYQSSSSWDDYLKDQIKKNTVKLPMLLCDACVKNNVWEPETPVPDEPVTKPEANSSEPPTQDNVKSESVEIEPPCKAAVDLARVLAMEKPVTFTKQIDNEFIDLKKVWFEDRHNLYGDLAHHYLSYLIRNTGDEHAAATRACIARFCSILPESSILATIERLRAIVPTLGDIFADHWDKIFTEFPIYQWGKEMRIDRLMLDTQAKKALILDFKTGGIHEKEQLDRYASALKELPAIQNGGFDIQYRYVPVKLFK